MGILYIGKYTFYGMWVVCLFWRINIRFSVILFDESLVFMLFSLFRFIWWYIVLLAMILLFHLCVNTCDVVNQFLLLISEAIDVSHALMSDSESLFRNAWCALWWQLFLNVIVLPLSSCWYNSNLQLSISFNSFLSTHSQRLQIAHSHDVFFL